MVLSFFALIDIYNGEPDTTSEWTVVRLFYLCTVIFMLFSFKIICSRNKQLGEEQKRLAG
jgi:hypothetical protein